MARKNNSSGYIGAVYDKEKQKYRGMVRVNKKLHHLGYFLSAWDAGCAHDDALLDLYGPNAFQFPLNRPKVFKFKRFSEAAAAAGPAHPLQDPVEEQRPKDSPRRPSTQVNSKPCASRQKDPP